MWCALVFYLMATIFVVVYSLPELCEFFEFKDGERRAKCGRADAKYTFDFIPPISQYISDIDLAGQPLKKLPYNGFRNLSSQNSISVIWLEHCQISHINSGALLNLHNLTFIDLSHNDITQIDSKLFSHTKQIKKIYLEYNKIEALPSALFQNLLLLEEVYLSNNRIHQVENYSFKNTPSLRIITLDNNQNESINMTFKDKFDKLKYLSIAGNPWRCDCELGPLYEFLTKINQIDEYGPACEKPPTLQGRKWSDISRDKFVCRTEDAISTQDSVMTSTEPMTTTEPDDNISVTVYNGTRYQQIDTGISQPASNRNWIPCTVSVLVLVCVAAVIIGVILFKRRSFRRTKARNIDSDLSMCIIHSRAESENVDSASNTDGVDEEPTSIHHYEIREATIN